MIPGIISAEEQQVTSPISKKKREVMGKTGKKEQIVERK